MNAIEQAHADRTSMAAARREALWMDIAFDNQRAAQRIDEEMQAKINGEKSVTVKDITSLCFPVAHWKRAVAADKTLLSYNAWVLEMMNGNPEQDAAEERAIVRAEVAR